MYTRQAVRGKVLAEFAADIADDEGWWFRAPKDPAIGVTELPEGTIHPDGIMPQLGSLIFSRRTRNVGHASSDGVLPHEGEEVYIQPTRVGKPAERVWSPFKLLGNIKLPAWRT